MSSMAHGTDDGAGQNEPGQSERDRHGEPTLEDRDEHTGDDTDDEQELPRVRVFTGQELDTLQEPRGLCLGRRGLVGGLRHRS